MTLFHEKDFTPRITERPFLVRLVRWDVPPLLLGGMLFLSNQLLFIYLFFPVAPGRAQE